MGPQSSTINLFATIQIAHMQNYFKQEFEGKLIQNMHKFQPGQRINGKFESQSNFQ